MLDEIGLDLAEYRQGRVLQPITSFRVGRQGGPMIDLDYDAAVSYGIRRCEFDRYLLERSGARSTLASPSNRSCGNRTAGSSTTLPDADAGWGGSVSPWRDGWAIGDRRATRSSAQQASPRDRLWRPKR